ncbi:MAG: cyclic nucleotide-binding domain-containing protein [Actinomycetota bacterium]
MRNSRPMAEASTTQRVERLRAVPIFAELDDLALRRVLDAATEFDAPPGQVLAEANMAGSGLVVIEDGTVAVELPGKTIELATGEFFGELSLLTSLPRVARVRATSPVRCLAISRADFERLLEQHPNMAVAMLRIVAGRLAALESR